MKIRKVEFFRSIYSVDDLPRPLEHEFVFSGRSNVGKSSLLNKLFGVKLARTSSKPGKTRSINFYRVNNRYFFVDLPGYGYAKVSKEERRRWAKLIEGYFNRRPNISMCFILMDMRHPPNENDLKMLEWVKYYGFDFTIVLTKVDKLKMGERIRMRKVFKDVLSKYGEYYTVEFSAMTGEGLSDLLDILGMVTGDKS